MALIHRRPVLVVAGLVALLAVALPAVAADPGGSPDPASTAPDRPGNGVGHGPPDHPKARDRGPEVAATLRGTVERTTDGRGHPTYTITVDGTTWELSAGPKWFWQGDNPLEASVGRSVEVRGTHREGETELDVEAVDGEPLREAGKPPWAGGPRVVGEAHPGWKPWKGDDRPGNGHGREGAPGQNKDRGPDAGSGEG